MGSLDVDVLYPPWDVERCAEMVAGKLLESNLVITSLVWKEIALYLRYHMIEKELEREGFGDYCPSRRHTQGKPTFRASGSDASIQVRFQPWIFCRSKPGMYIVRRMFCAAVKLRVVKTMHT